MSKRFNPWHHVNPRHENKDHVSSIIEIPGGTRAKYELDKESGLLILDRVLYSAMYYPANYGFIPQTYGEDNDPLDILVLSQIDVVPLCIVPAKVIGMMEMIDNGENDEKIIAVAAGDPSMNHINDIGDLPEHLISELRNFFEEYKKLENKTVEVDEFQGKKAALEIIDECYLRYIERFSK
ncbi:MAG: inorganic diphosphatase [Cryomorphaceae bacterium]|nr:inorganic diphosphatase [Flavobacteriales bacterium]